MRLTHWCSRLTNSEMAQALKTIDGRKELKQVLMTKLEDGTPLSSTELAMLIAIENIEREDGV